MICKLVDLGNGVTAIACYRKRRISPCAIPGCATPHAKLCDHPVLRKGKHATCDMKICDRHAKEIGPDRHYCPGHAKSPMLIPGAQPKLPGVK